MNLLQDLDSLMEHVAHIRPPVASQPATTHSPLMNPYLKITASLSSDIKDFPAGITIDLPIKPEFNSLEAAIFNYAAPTGAVAEAKVTFAAVPTGLEADFTVSEDSPMLKELLEEKVEIPLKAYFQEVADTIFVGHEITAKLTAVLVYPAAVAIAA